MSGTKRTEYNMVLGKTDDGEIYVLTDTFEHLDFKGATGCVVAPISEAEIRRALTIDDKAEWYQEIWEFIRSECDGTKLSLKKWVDQIPDDEYLDSRYEEMSALSTEEIAAALGDEPPARYQLVGIGRIFSADTLDKLTLIDSDEVRAAVADIRQHEGMNP